MNVHPKSSGKLQLAEQVRDACVKAALTGYEDAALRGLCHEGAWEAAISAVKALNLAPIVETCLAENASPSHDPA